MNTNDEDQCSVLCARGYTDTDNKRTQSNWYRNWLPNKILNIMCREYEISNKNMYKIWKTFRGIGNKSTQFNTW